MNLEVSMMSGAGNIFCVIDNRRTKLSLEEGRELAPVLCSGKGDVFRSEGMILVESPEPNSGMDFQMHFFNPDGSYGAMCGNGGRCAVNFAREKGFVNNDRVQGVIRFTTLQKEYKAQMVMDSPPIVRLYFPPPEEVQFPLLIALNDTDKLTVGYVNVGSDHAVVWFPEAGSFIRAGFTNFDIDQWGAAVRSHPAFLNGVNANFYTIVGEQTLRLRTFERGVEAETGACGTGAISTALIAAMRHDVQPPVRVIPTSGSVLIVNFHPSLDQIDEISLEGSAEFMRTVTVDV